MELAIHRIITHNIFTRSPASTWLATNYTAHTNATANRAKLTLVSNEPLVGDTRRYTFELTGPCQMNVYLSPAADNRLVTWTFTGGAQTVTSSWHERPAYLVFLSSGDESVDEHTFQFFIDIEVGDTRT